MPMGKSQEKILDRNPRKCSQVGIEPTSRRLPILTTRRHKPFGSWWDSNKADDKPDNVTNCPSF